MTLPIIDIAPLMSRRDAAGRNAVAARIEAACRDTGFFYIRGHGVTEEAIAHLDAASRRFFALPREAKQAIAMEHGGRAWRGWFPLEGELTSGVPDRKEGLYLGAELGPEHPRVRAGRPLHGANLWPHEVPELRPAVEAYMGATIRAAHALMEGIALALGLDAEYFARTYTAGLSLCQKAAQTRVSPREHTAATSPTSPRLLFYCRLRAQDHVASPARILWSI